jgi:hypothetical protein
MPMVAGTSEQPSLDFIRSPSEALEYLRPTLLHFTPCPLRLERQDRELPNNEGWMCLHC